MGLASCTGSTQSNSMTMKALLILTFTAFAAAQDTHYCPDGWTVSEFGDEKECILLGGLFERVTKRDAVYICAAHDAWLVDMDEGHGGSKNNFIKGLIRQDRTGRLGRPRNEVRRPVVDWSPRGGPPQRPQPGQLGLGPLQHHR